MRSLYVWPLVSFSSYLYTKLFNGNIARREEGDKVQHDYLLGQYEQSACDPR